MASPTTQSGFRCYHCGSPETSKAGFSKYGRTKKQRFFCRGCRRYFREKPKYIEGTRDERNFWVPKNLPSAGHLILELQIIAQDVLGRTPRVGDITELSRQNRSNSYTIYRAVFGTFRAALKRAGLRPDYPKQYDPEQILSELRALHKRLNRPLSRSDIVTAWKNGDGPSPHLLKREFGNMTRALEAAGAHRKKYTRAEMIEFLRTLNARLEGPVESRHIEESFRRAEGPSYNVIRREFGGLEKARRAAGINLKRCRKYTAGELIRQLRSLEKKLGSKPKIEDMKQASRRGLCASRGAFARKFGGMPEAYRQAGIKNLGRFFYTDEQIISAVKKLKEELGRFPTYPAVNAASAAGKFPSSATIRSRFGRLSELKSRL